VTIELDSVTNMLIYPDQNSSDGYTFLAVTVCHVLIVAAMTLPVAASAIITEIIDLVLCTAEALSMTVCWMRFLLTLICHIYSCIIFPHV